MKKNLIKRMLALICLGGIYFYNTSDATDINLLALENIEALAQGEGDDNINIVCLGNGSIDCRGHKVDEKITGFSLR